MRASILLLTCLFMFGCKESTSEAHQPSSAIDQVVPPTEQHDNDLPSTQVPAMPSAGIDPNKCGEIDFTSPGFDCNGRSLNYPPGWFDILDINFPHLPLTETQLDHANEVLLCTKQGARFCQSVCINQVFNFRHRYAVLYTGYIWPYSQCAIYVMGHNSESGYASSEYFRGEYSNTSSRVVGNCSNIELQNPTSAGFYDFKEIRVPQGAISPAPDRSRLYYALDLLDSESRLKERIILQNYQPMPDSNAVWSFSAPYGSIYAHFQQLPGFSCVKKTEITPSLLDLIR